MDKGILSSQMNLPKVYGVEQREPFASELDYFKKSPLVAGMATDDGRIITNPYSKLSPEEMDAVRRNEASRVWMNKIGVPQFQLTKEQQTFLGSNSYKDAPEDAQRATILARLLSGDPSGGTPTDEQQKALLKLKEAMGIK